MKLVKEHINEKFTADSDPIHDMNIGMMNKIIKYCEKDDRFAERRTYDCPKIDRMLLICIEDNKYDFVKYLLDNTDVNVNTGGGFHNHNEGLPLRYAVLQNNTKIAKLLVNHGAKFLIAMDDNNIDKLIRNKETNTGRSINNEIIELIKKEYKNSKRTY